MSKTRPKKTQRSYRYKVVEGSESAHCCFVATVVDTHHPIVYEDGPSGNFATVCECFGFDEANKIANALNKGN